jgi:molecular chaperone DnaK
MAKIAGIDLGTTNTVIAVMEGQEPTVISLSEGSRLCPSVVGFSKTGERLVGTLARRQAITNPERTVVSIKRHIGTDYRVEIDNRQFSPPEISAMILQKVKADAEAYLGEPLERAVITVPAYFSDAQRQATKDAGAIAGLDVVRIINEPTAAALAYGLNRDEIQNVLVWDLGGGTFDVSILELGDGVFEVRATSGDTRLGGDDWDTRLMDWLTEQFEREHSVNLRRDRLAMQRVRDAAEKAKIELSSLTQTNVNLPFLSVGASGPLHLDIDITRIQMERLTSDLLERLHAPTKQALADARMTPADLDRILLVGGSTRMPAVQEMAKRLFGKEPFVGINPDEAVARGAAIQGGVLNDDVQGVLLLDVTPLSLGIETLGGQITRIIERNTTIPTQGKETFTTAQDGQSTVEIKVYQGESELAAYNKLLANFQLTGITRAPKGVPQIEVTFDIDVNGIVHVLAEEIGSGRRKQIQVNAATGLSPDDISRLSQNVASVPMAS